MDIDGMIRSCAAKYLTKTQRTNHKVLSLGQGAARYEGP